MLTSAFLVFVCFISGMAAVDADSPCPDSWNHTDVSKTCIKAFETPKLEWEKARAFCQEQEGDLVEIKDEGKKTFVKGLLQKRKRYWIGAQYSHETKELKSLNKTNETASYQPWANHEPNNHRGIEECVEIIGNRKGVWNDKRCSRKRRFICERPVPTSSGPKPLYDCTFEKEEKQSCKFIPSGIVEVRQGHDHTLNTTQGHFLASGGPWGVIFTFEDNADLCLSFWNIAPGYSSGYHTSITGYSKGYSNSYVNHETTDVWTQRMTTIPSGYYKISFHMATYIMLDDIRISPGNCTNVDNSVDIKSFPRRP